MRECAAILSLMCSCLIGAPPALAFTQCGTASWYGAHGDHNAAHRSLPIGSKVHVENLDNGHKITVDINDRGPFIHGRIIDVSQAAAEELDFKVDGVAQVLISTKADAAKSDCR